LNIKYIKSFKSNTVKVNKVIRIATTLINLGPDKYSFKVTYKLPKTLRYYKPKVSTGKIKYNKKTRTLTWTISNLKISKKKSATIKWTLKTIKRGKTSIKPKISKVKGLKVSSNNAISFKVK
jgi:hypothetical protein